VCEFGKRGGNIAIAKDFAIDMLFEYEEERRRREYIDVVTG
jgi:hypothetical protein